MKKTIINPRTFLALLHDVLVASVAWIAAYLLRFNFDIPTEYIDQMLLTMALVVPGQAIIFILFSLYRGVWRFASTSDLKRILYAVMSAAVLLAAILFMFQIRGVVPRSVLLLNPILLMLMMGGSRFIYRSWKEHQLYGNTKKQGNPVLILGAGEAAIALVKDLSRSAQWCVVGMLDDSQSMQGREILGVKVIGKLANIKDIPKKLGVNHVIIAMPTASHLVRRETVLLAKQENLQVLTIPAFDDLMSGKVNISQIHKVEVEDLLGREPVALDNDGLHALIEGHAVMVTGAGGSIGSELCRQIVRYDPVTLICFDISEYALYKLEQELSQLKSAIKLIYITGDVKNATRVKSLLFDHQPSVVFHAAAYKHVPMMENGNVWEALSNNVIGTYTIAQACKEAAVPKFVLISTDKAVNPTNVMGASKRLAEMVCQGLQEQAKEKEIATKFVIVRFGNVLGSSGSVIPKFREQIARGGPITITHPEITRYFMSIPEAAQLVMQAGLMGKGGDIFVLDMGEPVKIAALAADMIRLSGLQTDEIKIEYVGLRPGEKLYEELLADDEHTLPTPHQKLRIAVARSVDKIWVKKLLKWIESCQSLDEASIKTELKSWVEEYNPQQHIPLEALEALRAEQVTIH